VDINLGFALLLTTLAGLSTGIGSIIALVIGRPRPSVLAVILGFSAGVMVYISLTELLAGSIEDIGFLAANLGFFAGMGFIALIDLLIPHEYEAETLSEERKRSSLMRAGVFVALGIAIHNFPEGLVVFSSAVEGDKALGIAVAIAVAMHNIPEGIAVSAPIFYATGSRRRAFTVSFLSGLAEPVGAFIGFVILMRFVDATLLSGLRAAVAGIMVYISLDELLPMAHRYGREHLVITGIAAGMAVMALSLFLLGD